MDDRVELSARERLVICEVVSLYLERGEAVASGLLAQVSRTGLSSASLRNIMADLERKGLLVQPHPSAGRIPDDRALKVYVDTLAQEAALPDGAAQELAARLPDGGSLDELLQRASGVLAAATAQVGLAAAPPPREAALEAIHFVKVSRDRVMAVVVTQGGLVDSRLLPTEREYQTEELERVSNYCTREFCGMKLSSVRAKLHAVVTEEWAKGDELLAGVLALTGKVLEGELEAGGEVFTQGAEHLLAKAGPKELVAVREFFRALGDKTALLQLLDGYLEASGPRVVVGRELAFDAEGQLSLIVTSFHMESGEEGLVGVVGFKRMDYKRIVPIVDFVGRFIAEMGMRRHC